LFKIKLSSVSNIDKGRCVYLENNRAKKVIYKKTSTTGNRRILSPRQEYEMLHSLQNISGLPENVHYFEDDQIKCISYDYVEGVQLDQIKPETLSNISFFISLSVILFKISMQGVAHRDLLPHNILVGRKNIAFLLDFDQAMRLTPFQAFCSNFVGIPLGFNIQYGSLLDLAEEFISGNLLGSLLSVLVRFRNKLRDKLLGTKEIRRFKLPILQNNAPKKLKQLYAAWESACQSDASSPGVPVCYYELWEYGYLFPGERPWAERWSLLCSATSFKDKRIVEIGCNLSLLSCFLLKYEAVKSCLCVDSNAEILASAQLVSAFYGVNPCYMRVDFDGDALWENDLLSFRGDLLFVLNVIHWVKNRQRLLNFISCFKEVVFEGHDNDSIEIERFLKIGFKSKVIGKSERARTVFLFSKQT